MSYSTPAGDRPDTLHCPRCGRLDQVQSVQSVHAAQSGVSSGSGVAGGGGPAGPTVMAMSFTGSSASHLALLLAPPPAPRRDSAWNCGVFMAVAVIIFMGLMGVLGALLSDGPEDSAERLGATLFAVGLFCLLPLVFAFAAREDRKLARRYEDYAAVWPAMLHLWRTAMICLRCHGAFFPGGLPQVGLAPGVLLPAEGFRRAVAEIGARLAVQVDRPPSLPPGEQRERGRAEGS